MKNISLLIMMVLAIALIGGFLFVKAGNDAAGYQDEIKGNAGNNANDVQKVTLGLKNYNYWPNEVTVKAGTPVEITLDESVVGCLRSFSVKDFGVSKYSKSPEDKIVFTPDKKGEFGFSCSMGMGYGKLIVK